MNEKLESTQHFGKILNDEDFFIFRPQNHYRIHSNLIVIRIENSPILLETGKRRNPDLSQVIKFLKSRNLDQESFRYHIISHAHQDHFSNLTEVQHRFPNIKTIVHQKDFFSIQYPFILPYSWEMGLHYKGHSDLAIQTYKYYYSILSNFYFQSIQKPNRIDYIFNAKSNIKTLGGIVQLIPTPGHTLGHTCVIDPYQNIYLADFVPFTPWIEPLPGALQMMINSINTIIKFDTSKIKRAIRGHGDIRKDNHLKWEISSWACERDKFKQFLDKIKETLELIPEKIKNKNVDLYQITGIFSKNFLKYSTIMRKYFIPPSVTWAIAYVLKLEEEGKITSIKKKNKQFWTA